MGRESGRELYELICEEKPDVIVETGVCNGFSTSVILKALDRNQKGLLYSIDLPVTIDQIEDEERTGAVIPSGKGSGWAVPENLEERWTLMEGDTYYELPKLFESLSTEIDIFIHDSGHSYETMMFEFAIGWRHLKENGFLLADNIDLSHAFPDFVEAKGVNAYKLGHMGLIQKREKWR
ncbi:MAG: class I SAM-dependent methyltransferase [Candidatus Thermoplasmatota archaeon]